MFLTKFQKSWNTNIHQAEGRKDTPISIKAKGPPKMTKYQVFQFEDRKSRFWSVFGPFGSGLGAPVSHQSAWCIIKQNLANKRRILKKFAKQWVALFGRLECRRWRCLVEGLRCFQSCRVAASSPTGAFDRAAASNHPSASSHTAASSPTGASDCAAAFILSNEKTSFFLTQSAHASRPLVIFYDHVLVHLMTASIQLSALRASSRQQKLEKKEEELEKKSFFICTWRLIFFLFLLPASLRFRFRRWLTRSGRKRKPLLEINWNPKGFHVKKTRFLLIIRQKTEIELRLAFLSEDQKKQTTTKERERETSR